MPFPTKLLSRRHAAALLAAAPLAMALTAVPMTASAQAFPSKPVRAVLPYSAGSGPDAVIRQIGEKLGRAWGQQLVVDNKPGANGWLAIQDVKRQPGDGYNLVELDNTHVSLQPHIYKQLPFDMARDFVAVAPLYTTNFFVVVAADSPWKNMQDLINAAKAKKGQLTYGSWGIGSVGHVGAAMLESQASIPMTHVPFKELPQLYSAVASHDVDWAFGSAATAGPLFRAGKVKFLALAAKQRLPEYANVPTVAEAGGPANFEVTAWVALYAPKGTPAATVKKINEGVSKALAEPDVKERFASFGFVPWIGTPADLEKVSAADSKVFAEIAKHAKISLD